MSGCSPKPYALGWHIPDFITGSTPCRLQTFNESRARLSIGDPSDTGGLLFRSVATGESANTINVSCEVTVTNSETDPTCEATTQPPNITATLTGIVADCYIITLFVDAVEVAKIKQVTSFGIDNTTTPVTEYSWVTYTVISGPAGSPLPATPVGYFKNVLSDGSFGVIMPDQDTHLVNNVPTVFTVIYPERFTLVFNFNSNLSGGAAGPATPGVADVPLRTGPMLSLIHINQSEVTDDINNDGYPHTINQTRYFNGACWKEFNPSADPCEYLGSPCFGSLPCLGTPQDDCP